MSMFDFRKFGTLPIVLAFLSVVGTLFLYTVLPSIFDSATILRIGDGVFKTQVISKSDDRFKILSDITNLDQDQAVLVVFPDDSRWNMENKDMKISVDVIWLSYDKRIIHIQKNIQPGEKMTLPKTAARYVIELPAGTVGKKAIAVNGMAIFQIKDLIQN